MVVIDVGSGWRMLETKQMRINYFMLMATALRFDRVICSSGWVNEGWLVGHTQKKEEKRQ